MSRLPSLVATAALVLGGAGGSAAQAYDPTICVDDICVCVSVPCLPMEPILSSEPICVRVDVDVDGDFETVCV